MLSWTGTAAAVAEMSWYCAGTGREVLCWEVWPLEQRRSGLICTRDEYWDHYITIIDTLHVKLAGLLIIKQLSVSHNSHTILIRYENLCEKYFAKPLNTDNLRLNNLIIQIEIRLLNLGFPGAVAVCSLSRKA